MNQNFHITKDPNGETWVRKLTFENPAKARSYALERRLSLQRLYQLTSEPYFGTPEEQDCKDNIDTSGRIIKIKNGEAFSLKLLSNKYHALGDCLEENNDFKAYYLFYICAQRVQEFRVYRGLSDLQGPVINQEACTQLN